MPPLDLADLPVLAAPMAGGPTTPALVAATAAAGALGFVPAGYRSADQLADDLGEVRALTSAYGVNLFVPDPAPVDEAAVLAYRDQIAPEVKGLGSEVGPLRWRDDDDWHAKVDLLVDSPAPWVSFTFGLPDREALRRLRQAGSRLLVTVTDIDEAKAAAELPVDGLVVQASAAGGHRGTFDQRRTPDATALPELLRAVVSATALPVVAAGGLSSSSGVAEALSAGAEAVQVGTALLLADEAATKPTHRRALTAPGATTTTMRAYTGRVARGIRTGFSDRYDAVAPPAYPALHHLTAPLRRWAAAHDDADHLHLWAGSGHRSATSGPVAELLSGLVP